MRESREIGRLLRGRPSSSCGRGLREVRVLGFGFEALSLINLPSSIKSLGGVRGVFRV